MPLNELAKHRLISSAQRSHARMQGPGFIANLLQPNFFLHPPERMYASQ